MATDYSSIYTIKEFYQQVLPLYFEKDKLALSTVGALGMFIDVNSSTTEDMMNIVGRYITEVMPGQAELPDFIYSQAANYGITKVLANPAKMSMLLLIKEANVINYGTIVNDHLEFTIDSNLSILVDNIRFSIPYDIKIRSTYFNGEYNHMSYYDENYSNGIVTETVPFIKTMKTIVNGDVWLVLRINVYQYVRQETVHPITTNSKLNIPYVDISFSDQLCNFEAFYSPNGSTELTQLEKKFENQQPLTVPFVYYKLIDDNTLRLSFANDDRFWVPEYNSSLTVRVYETVGKQGNFPFNKNGIDVYMSMSTNNETYAYNRNCFPMGLCQGNSTGGTNQLTLENIKTITTEKMVTVDSYTTDNDLNVYFRNFASLYGHDARFVKQRDDYAGREYGCYTKLSYEENIIPTNTVDMRIDASCVDSHIPSLRQFIVKPGTLLVYENDTTHDVVVKKQNLLEPSDIEYVLAPLMVISTKPNKVNYYINTIGKSIDVDYTYFNIDSVFNFVVNSCTISRNAILGENKYHIEIELARVDGVFNDLGSSDFTLQSSNGEIDITKLEVLIIFNTATGDYVRMLPNATELEEGEYKYTFSADIETTDTINDGRILLNNLQKRENDMMDERLVDMINPDLKFTVFYDYGESSSHEFSDISVVKDHTLCNVYTPIEGEIYFAYPLDLVRSHVMFEDNPKSELGYNFYVKQVPLFGKDFLTSISLDNILDWLTTEHTFLTNLVKDLHGLFTINMKFFNTYGRARNFYIGYGLDNELINHVNCTFSLGIKFYDGIIVEDYLGLIKTYIKKFFENLNQLSSGTNQAFISVLEHRLHENFPDQIKYAIFYSINGYDSKYQIVENTIDPEEANNVDYVPEYLTLTTDNISITVL